MKGILIAEDETIERKFLVRMVEESGLYRVVGAAEDGQMAVELAMLHRPELVLMDIRMPVLDGLEATRRIKRHLPETIVILNSAYAEFQFAQKAIEFGVDAYLVKPSSKEEILGVLASHLGANFEDGIDEARDRPLFSLFPQKAIEAFGAALAFGDRYSLMSSMDSLREYLGFEQSLDILKIQVINVIFNLEKTCYDKGVSTDVIECLQGRQTILDMSHSWSCREIQTKALAFLERLRSVADVHVRSRSSPVEVVHRFIDEHFREYIRVETLAKKVFLSPDYLGRLYREQMGESILQSLRHRRLEETCRLLLQTELRIDQIAEKAGFRSMSSFHKAFQDAFGMPPQAWRKKERGDA